MATKTDQMVKFLRDNPKMGVTEACKKTGFSQAVYYGAKQKMRGKVKRKKVPASKPSPATKAAQTRKTTTQLTNGHGKLIDDVQVIKNIGPERVKAILELL